MMTPDEIIEQLWNLEWHQLLKVATYDDFILMYKIWPLCIFLICIIGLFYIFKK